MFNIGRDAASSERLGERSGDREDSKDKGRLPWHLPAKASRNVVVSAMNSQEVPGKCASEHPAQRPPAFPLQKSPSGSEAKKDTSEQSLIAKVVEQHDQRVQILERDLKIYDSQAKRTMQHIVTLTTQLEEAKQQAAHCRLGRFHCIDKKLLEDINANRLSRAEGQELVLQIERKGSESKYLLDVSISSQY